MNIERFSFQNRHDLKIVGEVWHLENPKGLAFVQHGLSGYREQPHIYLMTKILFESGYTTVTFDATNSFGESDGKLSDITMVSHWEDLEDIIQYISQKPFYQEPFVLAGHSLGGFSILHFAEKYPKKIKAIAPTSTVLSGNLMQEANLKYNPEEFDLLKKQGYMNHQHRYKPEIKGIIPYSYFENCLLHDVLGDAHKVTCPIFLAVGDRDDVTPVYQQEMLRDTVKGPAELVIVPNCGHVFREPAALELLGNSMKKWLATF